MNGLGYFFKGAQLGIYSGVVLVLGLFIGIPVGGLIL